MRRTLIPSVVAAALVGLCMSASAVVEEEDSEALGKEIRPTLRRDQGRARDGLRGGLGRRIRLRRWARRQRRPRAGAKSRFCLSLDRMPRSLWPELRLRLDSQRPPRARPRAPEQAGIVRRLLESSRSGPLGRPSLSSRRGAARGFRQRGEFRFRTMFRHVHGLSASR